MDSMLAVEQIVVDVAERPVADFLIDPVRRRIREVGVKATVPIHLVKEQAAQRRYSYRSVPAPSQRGRRVDKTDAYAIRSLSAERSHRHCTSVIPYKEAAIAEIPMHSLS